jgi:uroporphyrinogen III methyltransferase/synthase
VAAIENVKVGVVGPVTAAALKKTGVAIDLVPDNYRAEGLISELVKIGVDGKKILLPRAIIGREVLPVALRKNGAKVTVATVYKTVAPRNADASGLLKIFADGGEIVLTFTSGSTVKNFFKMFTKEQTESFIDKVKIAAISPVTADIVERMGFHVDIIPKVYTAKDLADSIINKRNA